MEFAQQWMGSLSEQRAAHPRECSEMELPYVVVEGIPWNGDQMGSKIPSNPESRSP